VPKCPVCGSGDRFVAFAGLRDRAFRVAPGSWTLQRCRGCGSAYLDPRPSPETIELAYRTYYTHGGSSPPPPVGRFRRGLANDYRRSRFGYTEGPIVPGGRLVARLAPSRAAIVAREIRHLPAKKGGRLLDVGCGSGAFLAHIQALGWRAEGIDPDPTAVAQAREAGLAVTQRTVSDLHQEANRGSFDAVTLSHVIEHLHDPGGNLRLLYEFMRPGALLWIATPNLNGLGLRHFGAAWLGLDPPRHLVLFTRASLERLVGTAGFETLPAPPASPLATLMFDQSEAIAQGRLPSEGPVGGARRTRALAKVANWVALRDGRYADELVLLARRPQV
jgi:SAM-dependent methyltransferase